MNRLLKKQFVTTDPSTNGHVEKTSNPYLDARRIWNSQIDRAFSSLHVWQLVGVASLLIAAGSVAGIVYIGSQSKYIPWVIEVDKLGETVSVGPAQIAGTADPRVVRASLARFISAARQVTPDQDLQRKMIFEVFGMLHVKDPATTHMNEYLGDDSTSSPFTRAKLVTVQANISTVLPVTDRTWQVDWQEETRDRDGTLVGKPAAWRATLEIYISPPGDAATQTDIQRNPLGLWVRDFNWQQR